MNRFLLLFVLFAVPAQAERLVSNPAMCGFEDPMDSQEIGMVLEATGFWEIEYHCDFEHPVTFRWDGYHVETRAGYCEEPGPFITPTVFTLTMGDWAPGLVTVWQMGEEEPTEFRACP